MYGRGTDGRHQSEWSRGRGYKSRGRGTRGDGPPDSKYRKQVSDEAEEEVRELFQKKFHFVDEYQQWSLPDPTKIFQERLYKINGLLDIKEQLNSIKSKLDDKDIISWHKHTKFTNRAANLIPAVRKRIGPELCTQGWTKMQEMLTLFNIVPQSEIRLNSLHLCEAPGAFVTSLNHFLKTHRQDVVWQWKAMTLNPYYEGNDLHALIDQDRFMMESFEKWYLGRDNSGDILEWENITGLVDLVKKDFKDVNLVTADGSVDCANNPAEQEDMVSQLLFSEILAAVKVLKEGGCLILKTFTTLECQTVCLLYLLCVCFKEVNVFKPVTSKAGNSEQYIICMKYKGKTILNDAYWDRLKLGFGESSFSTFSLFPLSAIPDSFLIQLITCVKKFANYQINAINENVRLYECMKFSERKLIQEVKDHCCDEYINRCKLRKMPREKSILPTIHLDGMHGLYSVSPANTDPSAVLERRSTDSLLGRLEKMQKPWSDIVREEGKLGGFDGDDLKLSNTEAAKHVLQFLGCSFPGGTRGETGKDLEGQMFAAAAIDIEPEDIHILKSHFSSKCVDKHDLNTLNGRRVEKVTNSRFCRNDALKKLIEVVEKARVIQTENMTEFANIVSHCIPCHTLLASSPPFFLNAEGLNMAAIDALTGVISKISISDDRPLTFVDLWGAPSSYGQYVYWTRSNCSIKGWGVVRSERPSIRPSPSLARLVQWDSFQILGSVQGLNITNNDTIKSIMVTVEAECPEGVELIFADLSSLPFGAHPPGSEEYHTKQQLLTQSICALKVFAYDWQIWKDCPTASILDYLQALIHVDYVHAHLLARGGSFVIRVYSLLTRFSVGLLYLLYRVFQEVAILKPFTSSPASPEQFIVCKGFNGCEAIVCELLLVVNNHISDLKQQHLHGRETIAMDVLEIFPIHFLFEEAFYQYMTQNNERIVRLQTQTILQLEKYFLDPQLLPDVDLQEKLKNGVLELLKLPKHLS